MRILLIPILLSLAIGCTGGGSIPARTDVVTIGNSLTYHPVDASVEWSGSWGMASSAPDKDYSHLVAAELGLPLTSATNFAGLEQDPDASAADITAMAAAVKSTTITVVELGDNVTPETLADFAVQYGALLGAVRQARVLICTSTWWHDESVDAAIKDACAAHGGRYVFIGDLFTNPENPDLTSVQFTNAFVQRHPHDWGMAQIAERIVAASR